MDIAIWLHVLLTGVSYLEFDMGSHLFEHHNLITVMIFMISAEGTTNSLNFHAAEYVTHFQVTSDVLHIIISKPLSSWSESHSL
jgi:hypothetical protein